MANNWAIVIGINQYEHLVPERHLRFAVRDAEKMREFLCDHASFPSHNILLCTDESQSVGYISTRPALTNLQRLLLEHIQHATDADNFWFFFAGHGMVGDDRQDYLLPCDGYPAYLKGSAIPITFVTECLRNCHAKNVVLILDMCRREGADSSRDIGTEIGEQTIKIAKQQGIITIFSCNRGQYSYEIPALQQGAFTYILLKGLRQHTILRQLEAYLNQEVPALNHRYGVSVQMPLITSEPAGKYDLPLLPECLSEADIGELTQLAIQAELEATLEEDYSKAKDLWWQVINAPSTSRELRTKAKGGIERIDSRIKYLQSLSSISLASIQTNLLVSPKLSVFSESHPVEIPSLIPPLSFATFLAFEFETVIVDKQGKIQEQRKNQSTYHREDLGGGVSLDLVLIPQGVFLMGSPTSEIGRDDDEGPQRQVEVQPFLMSRCQITQAQWQAVAVLPKVKRDIAPSPSNFKGESLPVEQVSWFDATEFCARLSKKLGREYRLPSEYEWEYACRAGTTTPFYFGETISSDLANYNGYYVYNLGMKGQYRQQTTGVNSFPPNIYGLYDMHGNVWEWCQDQWYENGRNIRAQNSSNDHSILRGGSWYSYPKFCRSSFRLKMKMNDSSNLIGFRIASSL